MDTFACFSDPKIQDKWRALDDPQSLDRMCSLLGPQKSDDACDVGTGRGSAAGAIARHVKRVVTFDIADQSAHISKLPVSNVEFRVADIGRGILPCEDETFEIVICRAALHHLDDAKRFCQDAFRVLRSGGRLYVMDPVTSPELRLAWSVMVRFYRRGYKAYPTQQELLDAVTEAGFGLQYFGQFLFPRSVKQLVDERFPIQGQSGPPDYVMNARNGVWDIVRNILSEQMRRELHFAPNSDEGWFAYNCVELVATKP